MKWLIILLSMVPTFEAPSKVVTWAVNKESRVSIQGSSNIKSFSFVAKEYEGRDTLAGYESVKQPSFIFGKGTLHLPVNRFRNGNPILVKDFKKILNEKQYPNIVMNFRSLQSVPDPSMANQPIIADVDISLAGTTRSMKIQLTSNGGSGTTYLKGKQRLRFSDFGLTPPTKVMGFINVRDELDVDFCLVLKEVR